MSQQETGIAVIPTKKQVRKELVEKLTGALVEYKKDLGEKKLATHVKNISKLISRDLLKVSKKKRAKKAAPKKTSKKSAKAKAKK
jgi:predicted house-cleaning noncanonical NTP pyrophosphatase (MazG superfamily)